MSTGILTCCPMLMFASSSLILFFRCTVLPALCIRFEMGLTSKPGTYYLCRHMLCKQVLMDPVVLPCGHNFDSDCLHTWVDSKRTNALRVCPICRAAMPRTLPSVRRFVENFSVPTNCNVTLDLQIGSIWFALACKVLKLT